MPRRRQQSRLLLLRPKHFSLQKQSGQAQCFVAITTPLSWARTQLLSDPASTAVQPVQQSATERSVPDTDPAQDLVGNSELNNAAMQNAAEKALSTTLSSADAERRKAAACARAVLEAERIILAAASKSLKTYVVCPGVLYGECSQWRGRAFDKQLTPTAHACSCVYKSFCMPVIKRL